MGDEHRLAARLPELPPSGSSAHLPALIALVKSDLQRQWRQGRRVELESYLRMLPKLGSPDTIPLELILAEYEVRCQTGEIPELNEFEERFPRQAEALRQEIGRSLEGGTEVFFGGHLGDSSGELPHLFRATGRATKIPIKLSREFGRYRIIRRLGRGAMGSVYLAHDTQLGRRVALKVPHFRVKRGVQEANRLDLDRFYREARTAATLDHPNLCPVYDVGQIDGIHYLSMAYIKGRPLSDSIDPEKPMPPRRVAAVVRKLALALEVAHTQGVVHRDLKPSNIMVNSRRELIIMDFGLAWRIGSGEDRLTKPGLCLGTPAYMSPEQLSGKSEALGPRCDIYSLGVIMYELLTANRPFQGPEGIVLGQILYVEPEPPSGHRPDLDTRLEAICLKAIAKRAEDRYATMGEFAAALGEYLSLTQRPHRPPPAAIPPVTPDTDVAGLGEAIGPIQAIPPAEPPLAPTAEPGMAAPSEPTGTAADPDGLLRGWRRWTAIVEIFALRRSSQHVDWQAYHDLHKELIDACRARAAAVDEAKRAYYRQLEDLVLPWLTPKSLTQTDQEILLSLLRFCRQAERELGQHPSGARGSANRPSKWSPWVSFAALFVAASFVTALIVQM